MSCISDAPKAKDLLVFKYDIILPNRRSRVSLIKPRSLSFLVFVDLPMKSATISLNGILAHKSITKRPAKQFLAILLGSVISSSVRESIQAVLKFTKISNANITSVSPSATVKPFLPSKIHSNANSNGSYNAFQIAKRITNRSQYTLNFDFGFN